MKAGTSDKPRLRAPCLEHPDCRKSPDCYNRPICERGPPKLPEGICEDKFEPEKYRDSLYDKHPEDEIEREKSKLVAKVKDMVQDAKERLEEGKDEMKKMKYVCECGLWRPFDAIYYRHTTFFNVMKCCVPFWYLLAVLINILVFLSLF